MFNNRYIVLIIFAGVIAVYSCSKRYEKEPLENITEDYIWDVTDSAGIYARNFLQNTYTFLPNGFNRIDGALLCAASDDAVPSQNASNVSFLSNGGLSPVFNPDDAWAKNYEGIRKANTFLTNIDRVPMRDQQLKEWWRAEARFLRSIFYFELVKRYGGIPLIGDKVFTLEDDLQIPRNTFEECVNYIVAECDDIKTKLRIDPIDDGNLGRITSGAALALKAKMLLIAAS
ncbi:MAG: RagB/SusD family nutrient uptake outer membrane protein, partial [Chitinophagaceae bacterium]